MRTPAFYTVAILLSANSIPLTAQYIINIKQTFSETAHQIYFTGYSDRGNYIITTGSDNNIILWNAGSGIIYRTLSGLKKRTNSACFLENRERLYSGGEDNLVTVWNTRTMSIETYYRGHTGPVKAVTITPDGELLASGGSDRTVRVWETREGTLVYELKSHRKEVTGLDFSPDGKTLASVSADGSLILWNIESGGIIAAAHAHKGWIRDVTFCPDGKFVASCGDDRKIRIWTVPDLSEYRTLEGHRDWIQTIDYSPDGKYLLSGGHDQLIILWDAENGKMLCKSDKQGQIVLSVDIHPREPDFVSASLLSSDLRKWAISGPGIGMWTGTSQPVQVKTEPNGAASGMEGQAPIIDVYSPEFRDGHFVSAQAAIQIIGRVSDPQGEVRLLLNGITVPLSDAGIFQYSLDLLPGENPISLVASNRAGSRTRKSLAVLFPVPENTNGMATKTADIEEGRYFALLIGIDKYTDEGIGDLDNPVRDMENLYRVLLSKYNYEEGNITLLRNPTRDEMIMALDRLGGSLGKDDNLLIFYAGHGYWDPKGNIGYWLPSDADMQSTVNWFRNSTLRDYIGSIQTRHTLLIADACFSGAIFKTRALEGTAPKGIRRLYELPSRKAMTSGILQEVPDESVFLKYLVQRLEENEEKYLSSETLFSSFKTAVMNNGPNVPQYGTIQNVGDEGGEYIFIMRQGQPSPESREPVP